MTSLADQVKTIVERDIEGVKDSVIATALRRFLMPPEPHMRDWDYGAPGEQFLCWMVARDEKSRTGIVYCDRGFGPGSPWGLVDLTDSRIGMDCEWFDSLAEAFLDSFLSSDLRIWSVVEDPDGTEEHILASGLTLKEAFAERDKLNAISEKGRREVVYRPHKRPTCGTATVAP